MAQKIQVILVDDLVGGEAEETVAFSLDGIDYEIDLNASNATALREQLAGYIASSRRVGKRRAGRRRTATGGSDTAAIREWARSNGVAVSERGRVSADIVAQYEAANA